MKKFTSVLIVFCLSALAVAEIQLHNSNSNSTTEGIWFGDGFGKNKTPGWGCLITDKHQGTFLGLSHTHQNFKGHNLALSVDNQGVAHLQVRDHVTGNFHIIELMDLIKLVSESKKNNVVDAKPVAKLIDSGQNILH